MGRINDQLTDCPSVTELGSMTVCLNNFVKSVFILFHKKKPHRYNYKHLLMNINVVIVRH